MAVAVISDIHGNLAALEAVLEVVDLEQLDEIWCLGDVTGYGARPAECLELVRERSVICLAGNHDLVVSGAIGVDAFSADAAEAAQWSRDRLSDAERALLAEMPSSGERAGVSIYHGSVRDPIWEYVLTAEVARACLEAQPSDLALIGHSHIALSLSLADGDRLDGGKAAGGTEVELTGTQLLNPGSVGQPRDRDPRAAWLVLDLEAKTAQFRRTVYDIERTQAEILDAGLPSRLATRLASGI